MGRKLQKRDGKKTKEKKSEAKEPPKAKRLDLPDEGRRMEQ